MDVFPRHPALSPQSVSPLLPLPALCIVVGMAPRPVPQGPSPALPSLGSLAPSSVFPLCISQGLQPWVSLEPQAQVSIPTPRHGKWTVCLALYQVLHHAKKMGSDTKSHLCPTRSWPSLSTPPPSIPPHLLLFHLPPPYPWQFMKPVFVPSSPYSHICQATRHTNLTHSSSQSYSAYPEPGDRKCSVLVASCRSGVREWLGQDGSGDIRQRPGREHTS